MKILDKIKNNRLLINFGLVALGLLIGWLIFGGSGSESGVELSEGHELEDHEVGTIWTCSMHPQIQKDGPGKCPICGMTLIPLESDDSSDGEGAEFTVKLSNAAMKIAEVEMSTISKTAPFKEIYLPGKITADERNITELTARYPGRIEKLFINFTGQKVKKGEVLAKIYSPSLVTAQRELFEALKFKDTNPSYYKASRNKLKLWDLTDQQISGIEESGEEIFYFDVLSPITGTVTMRHVAVGDYVKEGSALFEVTDLRHVWVMFDAYESDLPWIRLRDKIKFTIKSIPGEKFEGKVTFIDPVINPITRVAGVRAELDNSKDRLKPQMLTSGILKTRLPGSGEEPVVPKSAVLWTGKNAVVYVMTDDHYNMFQYREIELGAEAGDYYVVKAGLVAGEMVASNGVFKIDAAAQLLGKRSMMNPEGGTTHTGHNHRITKDTKKMDEFRLATVPPMPSKPLLVDARFAEQLSKLVGMYLVLKDLLVEDNPHKANQASIKIQAELAKLDMGLLEEDAHNQWMALLEPIEAGISRIQSSHDIEEQRMGFIDLSNGILGTVKSFSLPPHGTLYVQHCPMANKDQGADWITTEREVKNPFFGQAMVNCGWITEEIK